MRRWWGIVAAAALTALSVRDLRAEPARGAAGAPAPVKLEVGPGGSRDELRLTLVNVSDKAVIVYIDRRLAQVELLGERGSVGACRLAGDAVPREPDDRRFVSLEPGDQTSEAMDLRFHCFTPGRRLEALATARAVKVTYRSRFATDRLGRQAFTGRLGPVEAALGPAPAATAPPAAAEAPVVTLRQVGARPDVGQGDALPVTIEVRGPDRGRLPVAVRPEEFFFEVDGPGDTAAVVCQLPATRVRPLAEFYARLGRRRVPFDLADVCPGGTFARPGVYSIRPVFRSTLDGADVGLSAWTGEASGAPFLARVRRAGRRTPDPVEITVPDHSTAKGAEDAR